MVKPQPKQERLEGLLRLVIDHFMPSKPSEPGISRSCYQNVRLEAATTTSSPTEEAEMLFRRKSAIPRSWRKASVHRLVMKNLVAQLSKDVVQREETRMPNSSTTFSKSTTWMPPTDVSMVLSWVKNGQETYEPQKHGEALIQNTVIVGRYLTKPAGSGVGALVAQNRYQLHEKKNTRKAGTEAREQREHQDQPTRATNRQSKETGQSQT